jgi:hypothetical protein
LFPLDIADIPVSFSGHGTLEQPQAWLPLAQGLDIEKIHITIVL